MFSSAFTGIGRYTFELVKYITEENNKKKNPDEIILFFNSPEFENYKCSKNTKKVLVNSKHYSLSEQTSFFIKLWKEKLDIMHFPHFNVPILYAQPFTVTIHDLTLSLFPGQKMTKWYHRLAYNWTIKNAVKRSERIVAVSENTKIDIVEHLKISPKKIQTIYNGISPDFKLIHDAKILQPTLKKYKITKPFLLYTGVWRGHKNLVRLIKAFKIVKDQENIDLQLVMTGKPDPHYPEVLKEIEKLGLENEVIRVGFVSEKELVHLFNAALFYVFPSLYEGFGLPPLESMACGSPVVCSESSCLPEICGEDNAIFFDPENVEELAQKITDLYKDPKLQSELVANGIAHAKKFAWEKSCKETYELILKSSKSTD